MASPKGQRPWSKKQKANPYAERGLDQFALVSAELQAARDRLVAQFGTQLSLVRFAPGSDHSPWIPIIVAPTSSKAEVRALRRAASDLVSAGKHGDFIADSRFKHSGSSSGDYDTHEGLETSDNNEVGIESSSADISSDLGANSSSNHYVNQTGIFGYFMVAAQKFLWMFNITVFGLRIIADLASKAILSEARTDDKTSKASPSLSATDENVIGDHPYADMASSSHASSQAQPTSITQRDIRRMLPPLSNMHAEAPRMHSQSKDHTFPSTTPSSPRDSQKLARTLTASGSLPKTDSHKGHTLRGDNKESNRSQKPNPSKVGKTSASMVNVTALKISPEILGQALSGAGLVLVLGGLVMGFIPAIICVVCWWYALPSMRKAIGDKPVVRSHHHHHHGSQELKSNMTISKKETRNSSVVHGVKNEAQHHEHKKKVITDGLLPRRRHSDV